MDCPVCGAKLREIERSGIEVDICPSCKGIWLDRGEIEKLIEVEARGSGVAAAGPVRDDGRGSERREYRDHDDHDDHDDRDHDDRDRKDGSRPQGQVSGGQKRRSSLLSDLLGGFGGD